MTDTTPTPADLLRAAAERARETGDPLHTVLAPLLEAVAVDAIRCRCVPECPTGAALAVARQLLGTTEGEGGEDTIGLCGYCGVPRETHHHGYVSTAAALAAAPHHVTAAPPAPADRATTRDRIRRAICEASGFDWDPDTLEPDEYGEHADAVLAVLAADAAAGVQPPTTEAHPARRRLTPNEHDRAWHAIEGSAGEPGADPDTILNAVLHALRIDIPTPAEEQAASPTRRTTKETTR
ncbi:hypothetical protein [Streptomyces griseus]|uniref:hypothetical protein n=1 Tax=Streptomyces griseus TaxID=1911 RepID=UPI0036F5353A